MPGPQDGQLTTAERIYTLGVCVCMYRLTTDTESTSVPQSLYVSHLLDRLRCEDNWASIVDADAVLDTDPHPPEVYRPPVVIGGDVDARLYGDAVTGTKGHVAAVAGAVVHVEPDVMAHVVREQRLEAPGAVGADVEPESRELLPQRLLRRPVHPVQRQAAVCPAERHARPLHAQYRLVQVALRRSEFAIHWPRARDVGDVGAVLAARVHQHHLRGVVVEARVVEDVVDHVCAAAARHDGHVRRAVAPVCREAVLQERLQVALAGPGPAHGGGDGAPGHAPRVPHVGDLGGRLDHAQLVGQRLQAVDADLVVRRLEDGVAEGGQAPVRGAHLDVCVDAGRARQDRPQVLVQLLDVAGAVGVEDVLGRLEAAPGAGPLLRRRVFGPDEEVEDVVAQVFARLLYHGRGLGLIETREVEEVGLLSEGVEDGARAPLDVGGAEDCDAILGELLREAGAAVEVLLGRDAGCYWRKAGYYYAAADAAASATVGVGLSWRPGLGEL